MKVCSQWQNLIISSASGSDSHPIGTSLQENLLTLVSVRHQAVKACIENDRHWTGSHNLQSPTSCWLLHKLWTCRTTPRWFCSIQTYFEPYYMSEKSVVVDLHFTASDSSCFAMFCQSHWQSYCSPQESIQVRWKRDKPNSTQVSAARVLILRLFHCFKSTMLLCLTV